MKLLLQVIFTIFGRVINRGCELFEVGVMKLKTVVSLENAVILNLRSYTESHEMTVAQLL